jgi:hypothetical protein
MVPINNHLVSVQVWVYALRIDIFLESYLVLRLGTINVVRADL